MAVLEPSAKPDLATRPGIGVVLVNYRCADLIEKRLSSGALDGFEVVLVDNASDPHTIQELAERFGARSVLRDFNSGFAGGVNAGIDEGLTPGCDAYLLLNPDVEIEREQVLQLYRTLRAGRYAAVAPIVLDGYGRPWVSTAGGPVTLRSVVWYFAGLSHLLPRLSGFFWTRKQIRHAVGLLPGWLCGASLMIDAAAWARIGALPEDEVVYGEDVVWGARCVRKGGRLGLVRHVELTHVGGASGESDRWVAATGRMFVREMGPVRGRMATAVMRTGLTTRRWAHGLGVTPRNFAP